MYLLPSGKMRAVKKAALYVRVSTQEQNTDMQQRDLQEYAEKRGYQIFQVYRDVITGTAKARPGLDQLMRDAKKRRFDIVLVWKFDRFARSLSMLVIALEAFRELGIDFISYQDQLDTTTSMGRLMFNINASYAEFERELIGERVKAGVRAKREKTGTWGRGKLNAVTRQKIQELATTLTVRAIAEELGISTRTVQKYKR